MCCCLLCDEGGASSALQCQIPAGRAAIRAARAFLWRKPVSGRRVWWGRVGESSPEDMTLLRPSLQRHSSNVAFLFVSCFLSSSCLISRLQICFQHFWCWLLVKISDVPAQYVFCLCCALMIMWPSKLRMSLLTNTRLGSTQLQLSQSQRSQSSREMDSFHS